MKAVTYASVALIVLCAAYIGSYYALVQPEPVLIRPRRGSLGGPVIGVVVEVKPAYRFGDDYAAKFYSPWHTLDRRLRPETWAKETYGVPLRLLSRPGVE